MAGAGSFVNRVPAAGKEGYRKFTFVSGDIEGVGVWKVEMADEPTEAGTPFDVSNVAGDADMTTGTDDEKMVTPKKVKDNFVPRVVSVSGNLPKFSGIAGAVVDSGVALSGADLTAITGTAGTNGNLGKWNVDGDLVDSDMAEDSIPKLVNRKDYTTDNTVSEQLIQVGWGYIEGSGGTAQITALNVPYPVAYDTGTVPIILISSIGRRSSVPADPSEMNGNSNMLVETNLPDKDNFNVIMIGRDAATTTAAGTYYGYSWMAIGTKTR